MVEEIRIFRQKPTVGQLMILILWRYMRSHMMIRGSVVGFRILKIKNSTIAVIY